MTLVARAAITDQPILLAELEELVSHQAAGAVVGFAGVIRNHDGGRQVTRLEYSAHPWAADVIAEIVTEVAAQSSGDAGCRGRPSGRRLANRRTRFGCRRRRRSPRGGVRDLRAPGGRHQGAVTGVEKAALRRRKRRVGRLDIGRRLHSSTGERRQYVDRVTRAQRLSTVPDRDAVAQKRATGQHAGQFAP